MRIEVVGEGRTVRAEPAELPAPATPHLYTNSPLLGLQYYACTNVVLYSAVLDRMFTVSESYSGPPLWEYQDWLELRTTGGRVEKMSKFLPINTYSYGAHVIGTKAYLSVSQDAGTGSVGHMLCVDLETFTIEWQDSLRVVSPSGYGLYCDFGGTWATQHAYWVGFCKDSTRVIILKYTLAGVLVWQKQFAGITPWSRVCVIENADGSLFVASDTYLEKWDADGNRLWSKKLAVQGAGAAVFLILCLIEHEGALYAVISARGGAADAFLCKLDLNGNIEWYRTYVGHALEGASVAPSGIHVVFDRIATPHDAVSMVVTSDNEVLWSRKIRSDGVDPVYSLWPAAIRQAGAYTSITTNDQSGSNTESFVLPSNGSGQGTYGDNAADRIGKWVYENCDEPTAGAQTITMVDDAGFTLPTPYALEAAPEVVELIPIIQHFGANA